jgi:hypothetical protein
LQRKKDQRRFDGGVSGREDDGERCGLSSAPAVDELRAAIRCFSSHARRSVSLCTNSGVRANKPCRGSFFGVGFCWRPRMDTSFDKYQFKKRLSGTPGKALRVFRTYILHKKSALISAR